MGPVSRPEYPAHTSPPTALWMRAAFRCLSSPSSLAAIAVLLVNDHLLKRVWPSWLTGKLSDFAGLYFAPYVFLLVALASVCLTRKLAGSPREGGCALSRRAAGGLARAVFVLTGAFFAALKLPPTAAPALRAVEAALGWPVAVMVDPTDLLALAALALAYAGWQRRWPRSLAADVGRGIAHERHGVWRRARQLALLAVATLAMTASMPPPYPCLRVTDVAADPQDPNVLYATKIGYSNCGGAIPESPERLLFVSRDAGSSWREAGPGGERVVPDPTQPGILYFANTGGLARADVASGTWRVIVPPQLGERKVPWAYDPRWPPEPGKSPRYGIGLPMVVSPWGTPVLYAGVCGAVARSYDEGTTWQVLPLPVADGTYVQSLAVAPSQPGLLYASTGGTFYGNDDERTPEWQRPVVTSGTLYRSDDAGDTWREVSSWEWTAWVLAVDPADPARLLGGTDKSIVLSEDGGLSWREVWAASPRGMLLWEISFDPRDHDTVFVAAYWDGLLVSSDGGRGWQQELEGVEVTAVAQTVTGRLYAVGITGWADDGVYRQRAGFRWPWHDEWEPADRGLGQAPRRSGGLSLDLLIGLSLAAVLGSAGGLAASPELRALVRAHPWETALAVFAGLQTLPLVSVLLAREPRYGLYGYLLSALPAVAVMLCLAKVKPSRATWAMVAVPLLLAIPAILVRSSLPESMGYDSLWAIGYEVPALGLTLGPAALSAYKGHPRAAKGLLAAAIVAVYWPFWWALQRGGL